MLLVRPNGSWITLPNFQSKFFNISLYLRCTNRNSCWHIYPLSANVLICQFNLCGRLLFLLLSSPIPSVHLTRPCFICSETKQHFLSSCLPTFSQTNTVSFNLLGGFPRSIIRHSAEERRALSATAVVLSSDCDRGTDSSVRERGPRCYRKVKWQAQGMKRLLNKARGWPIEMSCTGLPLIRESLLSLTEPLGPDTPDWSVAPAPTRASVCVSTLGQHACVRRRSINEPRKWDKRRVIATPITVKLPEKGLY